MVSKKVNIQTVNNISYNCRGNIQKFEYRDIVYEDSVLQEVSKNNENVWSTFENTPNVTSTYLTV